MDCLFCKIADGQIPSDTVYEDDCIKAFRDIAPQAPVHILVIPKVHVESTDDIKGKNSYLVARVFEKIPAIAKAAGLKNGYRVITNCGPDAAQSVKHLHFHIVGGTKLSEKMA